MCCESPTAVPPPVHMRVLAGVLQLGAIEDGGFHIAPQVSSCASMLHTAVHQLTPWATADSVTFSVIVDVTIPPALLFDSQRLSQVVCNMCTNAFKFVAHDGGGRVTLRAILVGTRSGEHDDAFPASIAPPRRNGGSAGAGSRSPVLLVPT